MNKLYGKLDRIEEPQEKIVNPAEIKVELDCINCPLQEVEEEIFVDGIKKLAKRVGVKIVDIKVYR